MSNGAGGAQAGGEAIFSAVGTAAGSASTSFEISLTPASRQARVATASRVATVKRMSEG